MHAIVCSAITEDAVTDRQEVGQTLESAYVTARRHRALGWAQLTMAPQSAGSARRALSWS